MAEIKDRKFDAVRKLEIVTIADEFGATMIVQHPLSRTAEQRDRDEQEAIALMDGNAATFKALMAERENK